MVNGPVLLVMVGPALAAYGLASLLRLPPAIPTLVAAVGGWVCAWLTWSVLTPRWRLWAYTHVEDLGELKRLAVADRLIWPDGHIFGRTEIAPRRLRERLRELEAKKGAAQNVEMSIE